MYQTVNRELEKKYKISEFPLNVAIEVTNCCNLNCIMCGHDKMTRKKGNMEIGLYKRIIDEVATENPQTRIWLDFYGEPLLAGYKLYYMIRYAKERGCLNVVTNTNGTLLNKEYTDMLLDSGIDYISIDCEGLSKEVYESIRINADRDVFYENIEYLLEEKKRRALDTIIDVKVIEMEINKHEVDDILKYWSDRGAWVAKRKLSDWAGYNAMTDKASCYEERIACGHAVGTCAISWEGYVAGCAWDSDLRFHHGNVYDDTIKNIWNKRNNAFVKLHMEHRWDELPEMCSNCNTWKNIGEMRFDENGSSISREYSTDRKIYQ